MSTKKDRSKRSYEMGRVGKIAESSFLAKKDG